MNGKGVRALMVCAIAVTVVQGAAQESLAQDDLSRADAAVREAFAFLYQLPSDTAAARLGSWVLDSVATTPTSDRTGRWRIVVTKLIDTGQDLKVEEMVGEPGTSPAQLAAAVASVQQLEAKISKAEAEASLEVVITVNAPESAASLDVDGAPHRDVVVRAARLARHTQGYWKLVEDPELGISVDRWSPATLVVRFGSESKRGLHTVVVTARGNEEMVGRVLKETRWETLSAVVR